MARVTVQVAGGSEKQVEAESIADLKEQLGLEGYTASVDGEPADDSHQLENFQFVSLSQQVKGATPTAA